MAADQVKVTITAEDATRGAFASVQRSLSSLRDGAASAVGALGAIGAGLSLAGIIGGLRTTVESMDALNDAADRTGSSVEDLSSLLNTLAPYGASLEQITDATGKLARAMAGADDETKGAGEAFAALGIATRDAAGNLRPTVDVLDEVAQALNKYEDGTNKTVLAQTLFGKSGAQLLPMLKDLAGAKKAAASVTSEQAAQAERLNVEMGKLKVAADALAVSIAGPVVKALNDLVTQFRLGQEAAGGFWSAIGRYGLMYGPDKSPAERIDDVSKRLAETRTRLAAAEAQAEQGSSFGRGARTAAGGRAAALREEIAQYERDLRYFRALVDLEQSEPGYGGPPKDQAPKTSGGGKNSGGRPDSAYAELDALIMQSLADEKLREDAEAAKLLADALKAAVDEMERLEQINTSSLERALRPDNAGWQKVADTLKEIRGVDAASKLRDAALEATNSLLDAGAITFDEYEKLGSKILNLKDPLKEVADASASLFAPISSALEDALVNMRSLGDVAKGLAQDIARIMLRNQLTGPIDEYLGALSKSKSTADIGKGTLFGAIRDLLRFADGGEPPVGVPSIVGERGPELFVPKVAGTIVPNGKFGGGVTVVNHINVSGEVSRADVYAAIQAATQQTRASILSSMGRNGSFARA
ncbi:MAG: hypothetical protein RJA99_4239 [Pseudomonadota bacterium]|jgi:hypothetical protein